MAGKSKSGRALKAAKKPTQTKLTKTKEATKKEKPKKKQEKPAATDDVISLDDEPKEKPMLSLAERLAMKRTDSTSSSSSVTSEASVASKKQSTLTGFVKQLWLISL